MKKTNTDSTTVEIIVGNLKEAIKQGALKPGEKLPTQREMESMYCVSRIVVREAIKVLEGMGLLYSRQGSGIYVTDYLPLDQPQMSSSKEYSLWEIYSLFESIYDYALFQIKYDTNLSELEQLQQLNKEMLENYSVLTNHQKFSYESSFGSRLLRLSKNTLACDLYLLLIKPLTSTDYALVIDNDKYYEILEIDKRFIEAILKRDLYKAAFWGHERNARAIEVFSKNEGFWEKKYCVFSQV